MNQPSAHPLYPPRYVNVSLPLAYAQGNEPAILTLIRIVSLTWEHGGRRTPALTKESLVLSLQRGPRTLNRHLAYLQDRGWLRIERVGPAYILRPLLDNLPPLVPVWDPSLSALRPVVPTQPPPELEFDAGTSLKPPPGPPPGPIPWPDPELQLALAEVGIENPARDELACRRDLDPSSVRAWHLWTRHPQRASLENPPGYIVGQLRAGHAPPDAYRQLVDLSEEQWTQLLASYWTGGQDLDEDLDALRPLFRELFPAE